MHKKILMASVIVVVFVIALLAYNYLQTLPYANYKTGEAIEGFPFEYTSMTVNNFSTAPDATFPNSATDLFVNVTIQKLESPSNQSEFASIANKHLFLRYQTYSGHGEVSATNDSYDFGIVTPNNKLNSLSANQSVNGLISFVLGNNNNYNSLQLVCLAGNQQKPLFIVDLQSS